MNNKSQKLILLSFMPAFIAFIFLIYVLVPCYGDFNTTKENIKTKKAELILLKEKAKQSQENKKLYDDIQKIEAKLGNFDARVPKNKDLEILLIDVERFAAESNLKILSMEAKPSNPVILVDTKSKSKLKRSSRTSKKVEPLSIFKVPMNIKVSGYYPDVIKFVSHVEKYQRLISIDGVSAKNSLKDSDLGTSKVDMVINANIYIQKENPIPEEEETKSDDAKNEKTNSNEGE